MNSNQNFVILGAWCLDVVHRGILALNQITPTRKYLYDDTFVSNLNEQMLNENADLF